MSFSFQLAVYLKELKLSAKDVGLMFSLTLIGDAVLSIAMTSRADKWGRRKTLILSSFFSIFTAVAFASQINFWILLTAAVIGVISPSGNDIGPFLAIELSGTVPSSS
jgi:MFS family permease